MMTTDQFSPYSKVLYAGVVPLVAVLFLSFAGRKATQDSIDVKKVFVIDAAHGGTDAGSISPSGLSEKNIALDLSKLVYEVGKERGLNILLTRTTDQLLTLRERVDFSADAHADVFLSLHVRFESDDAEKGAGLYVSDENPGYEKSKRIASVLSKELGEIEKLGGLRVVNSSAFILKHNHAASTILEIGNVSNEQDAWVISDPTNQRRIAEKIVSALIRY